jgi:hypothetical protein
MPKQLGVPGAVIDMPESVLILDPVAGFRYELDSKKNTARQYSFRVSFGVRNTSDSLFRLRSDIKPPDAKDAVKPTPPQEPRRPENDGRLAENQAERERVQKERAAASAEREAQRKEALTARNEAVEKRRLETVKPNPSPSDGHTRTESLGVQNIEGVNAEGVRTTTTIPAGTIGNEREINVTYEKWYSKDLQIIVLSKHNDPRFGEQTYRVTNINRSEPPASLFSPPADYTVINGQHPQAKPLPTPPRTPSSQKKPPAGPAKPLAPKKAISSG